MRLYIRLRPPFALSAIYSLLAALLMVTSGGIASAREPRLEQADTKRSAREQRQRFVAAAERSLPAQDGSDRTLSPFFFVDGGDPNVDVFPLKSTRASVRIAGSVADVAVTQIYRNNGSRTLEALYLFPLSTRAAVHAMKMTIGDRIIEAQIHERELARKVYAKAHAEGRTASLLEQLRPNVFQMNITNIHPGDEVRVELSYAELIVPEQHVYEFVYPTVVGPRYSNAKANQTAVREHWVESPYLQTGAPAAHTFSLDALVESGIPLQQVTSPGHEVHIQYPSVKSARVTLAEGDDHGDRDFILRYSLAGNAIESGLLLQPGGPGGPGDPGDKESFFLFMMEPPARVEPRDIVPREYIFIVDVSGSMSGFPLDVTKRLMGHLFAGLQPRDSFNILTFSGGSALLSPVSLPATADNVQRAADFMENQEAGGGTELLPALERVLLLPRSAGTSRVVVVATDGYVTVEKEAFELIRSSLGHANLFAFGIGSSVNRHLIEGMARAGMGEPFVVSDRK